MLLTQVALRIVAFSVFRINISNHLRVSLASKFELEFLSISRFISVVTIFNLI